MGFSRVHPDIRDFEFMCCLRSITPCKMWLHCTINTKARAIARNFTIKMETAVHSKCLQLNQPQLKYNCQKWKVCLKQQWWRYKYFNVSCWSCLKRLWSLCWSSSNDSDASCWSKRFKNTMYIIHNTEIHKTICLKKWGHFKKFVIFTANFFVLQIYITWDYE
jgi:hypothetical protein